MLGRTSSGLQRYPAEAVGASAARFTRAATRFRCVDPMGLGEERPILPARNQALVAPSPLKPWQFKSHNLGCDLENAGEVRRR